MVSLASLLWLLYMQDDGDGNGSTGGGGGEEDQDQGRNDGDEGADEDAPAPKKRPKTKAVTIMSAMSPAVLLKRVVSVVGKEGEAALWGIMTRRIPAEVSTSAAFRSILIRAKKSVG